MKPRNIVIVVAALLVVVGVGLYFYVDPFGPTRRHWIEDVDLGDGRVIQVERTVAFNATNSISGDAHNAVEAEATIAFTGELASLPPWSQPLMALVLYQDKHTREWVVVATTTSCEVWNMRGEPEILYWEFHLNKAMWRETPLSKESIGRPANLLHRYQQSLGTRHVTVKYRQERESDIGIGKRFRNILADDKINCEKALKY